MIPLPADDEALVVYTVTILGTPSEWRALGRLLLRWTIPVLLAVALLIPVLVLLAGLAWDVLVLAATNWSATLWLLAPFVRSTHAGIQRTTIGATMTSWLILATILAVVWALSEQIGQGFDWVLDRMGWDSDSESVHGPTITDEWCPCATDRSYHSRMTETKD